MKTSITIEEVGEFGLISELAGIVRDGEGVIKGIGDDAAVINADEGRYLLLAVDTVAENIHFRRSAGPRRIGRKALAVNLSDIAAMGGIPRWTLVSLGIPAGLSLEFCRELYRGISDIADGLGVGVVGGDTFRMEKEIVISVTLGGEVEKNKCVFRSGARPGDAIMVTGVLGAGTEEKHLEFTPRVKEARFLVDNYSPTSMIDLSDGLFADLEKICHAGKVGAWIRAESLPVPSSTVLDVPNIISRASGGEEFELLFTVPVGQAEKLLKEFYPAVGTGLSRIGEVKPDSAGIVVVAPEGETVPFKVRGYDHFGGGD